MQCLCGSVCHLGTPTASGSVVTDQRWLTYRHFHQANSMQWCCWVGLESSVRQIYTDKIYICTTICSCAVTTIPVSLLTLLNSVQPLRSIMVILSVCFIPGTWHCPLGARVGNKTMIDVCTS